MSALPSPKQSRHQQLQAQLAAKAAEQAGRRFQANSAKLGRQIRTYRQTWRMSQRQLAQLAGTTQTTIAKIEAGQGNPTLKTLEAIAAAMPGMELKVGLDQSTQD